MRVVLDTNGIVSGLNSPGNERLILDLAFRQRFDLYLSPFILSEAFRVLIRKFGWGDEEAALALAALGNAATVIEPARRPPAAEGNQGDNRVLECAVEAAADFLVPGDRRHLLSLGVHEGVAPSEPGSVLFIGGLPRIHRRRAREQLLLGAPL